MPAPTTVVEFLELVKKSGVVDASRLDAHVQKLQDHDALPAEPKKTASVLIRDGLLTIFQAEQLLLGKWKRFTVGQYKVLERLGTGGMGQVYLCEHLTMRNKVAVKILPTAKAKDPSSLQRFFREARAAGRLDHPNLVRAFAFDQQESGSETLNYLVMEYVDGASLQEIVKRSGPLDHVRACHYIFHAAQGLQYAYEVAELVHRDVKPGNIMVDRQGFVKLLDMGLARFFNDNTDNLTRKYEENVLGTADYLSPEQVNDSHEVDVRADIYSLGATFYFLLTGKPPFPDGTIAQKLIWHQTRQPKPVRLIRPDVPEGVAKIIERMMMKDAAARYQTPSELAGALAPFVQQIPPPVEAEIPRLCPAATGELSGDRVASPPPAHAPAGRWTAPVAKTGGSVLAPTASPPNGAAPRRAAPAVLKSLDSHGPNAAAQKAKTSSARREGRNPFAHLLGGGSSNGQPPRSSSKAHKKGPARAPAPHSFLTELGTKSYFRVATLAVGMIAVAVGAFAAWRLMLGLPAGWW